MDNVYAINHLYATQDRIQYAIDHLRMGGNSIAKEAIEETINSLVKFLEADIFTLNPNYDSTNVYSQEHDMYGKTLAARVAHKFTPYGTVNFMEFLVELPNGNVWITSEELDFEGLDYNLEDSVLQDQTITIDNVIKFRNGKEVK